MSTRIALVTGGSRGIGKAIAAELARAGLKVAITYKEGKDAAEHTAAQINSFASESTQPFHVDIENPESIKTLFQNVKKSLGTVSVLVNNAGIHSQCPLPLLSDQEWNSMITTNLSGAFLCTREAVRDMMRQKWGRIIFVSSDAAMLGESMGSHYAASKAGMIGLAKSAARELAPYSVTVNTIAPGFIQTDMTANTDPAVSQKQTSAIPMRKFGTPEDVAHIAAFLASDTAGYITGQTISVDGGLHM
ncbi:MAG: 3-oxoacyl-ACP reductase FabG [Victivallales bacterium]|nr:3-oxoacyl-ACP reductase FabG [Victivallales bacterium]